MQEYDASDPNNQSPATDNLRTEFVRGEGMGGGMVYSIKGPIGNPQSEIGNIICSHANHRGDIIARSNASGSLTSFALYEAYGTRPYEWGSDPDRQKANTKEEETDLNLLNEGMRYRDLETGTFLTRDPIGYADGPNVYCYVHCNPITRFDAFGLEGEDIDEFEEMDAEEFEEEIIEDRVDPEPTTENVNAPSRMDAALSFAEQMNKDKGNNKDGFGSAKDAAKTVLDALSILDDGSEHGGFIYSQQNEAGKTTYHYTNPVTDGKPDEITNPTLEGAQSSIPEGGIDVALYHNHGSSSGDGTSGDNKFSPEDVQALRDFAGDRDYASYLGTPSGNYMVQYHSAGEGGLPGQVTYPDTFHKPSKAPPGPGLYDHMQPPQRGLFD